MCDVLPGILEQDWGKIEEKLAAIKPFAKAVHIDLLDGKFAPNTSFLDPAPFAKYAGDFFLELHMMVDDPMRYLVPFADAGFRRFVGHVEMMPDQVAFVAKAEALGEVVLAVDAETEVDAIEVPFVDLDGFLVMTVKAGFSGQQFMPENLTKVRAIRKRSNLPIEIDGGVNDEHLSDAVKAGANRFVATSFLFRSESPQEQYRRLKFPCQ